MPYRASNIESCVYCPGNYRGCLRRSLIVRSDPARERKRPEEEKHSEEERNGNTRAFWTAVVLTICTVTVWIISTKILNLSGHESLVTAYMLGHGAYLALHVRWPHRMPRKLRFGENSP